MMMIGTDSRILTGRITTISQFIEEGLVEEEEEESNAVVRNEVVGNVSEWLEALADIDSIDTERERGWVLALYMLFISVPLGPLR